MVLGGLNLLAFIDILEEEGCTRCGEQYNVTTINGPEEVVLECDDVFDMTRWPGVKFKITRNNL